MTSASDAKLDLVWEVAEIAKIIGRTERQTSYMLSAGQLPGKKVGGRWVVELGELTSFFIIMDRGRIR